ncbi:flagellar hook-associated protein FlgK [Halomonas sp. WWR20]
MSIFSIGLSGLSAAQSALATTSNNISNVYTPGYNRQLTILGESGTSGSVGMGVSVDDTQRQYNQYLTTQYNQANSATSALSTYQAQVSQIDNLLADSEAGLAPLMQDFFAGLEDLTGAPSDPAARQGVLGTADSMTAQFRAFDSYLEDMQSGINSQIKDTVTQVNNTAEQVANLNREISLARAKTGEEPNSLLDQRDQLVSDLNELVGVSLTVQDGGSYTLSIGNGQPLVAGQKSFALEATASSEDPTRTTVGYRDAGGSLQELDESLITKGELGGLLTFRSETLDGVQNRLGQLAVSVGGSFNAQHGLGVDLKGEPGGEFFSIGEPNVISNTNNNGDAVLSGEFSDINAVTASDYRVTVTSDDEYQITRLSDNTDLGSFALEDNKFSFDGVTLELSEGAAQANDTFLVQPTRQAAGQFEVQIRDTSKIAAAQSDATGDNRNAMELLNLQQNKTTVGQNASFSDAYASLVSEVGNRTNIVQVNLSAQEGLTEQLRAFQQAESGVNLDEEFANLVKYQQFYQANAKTIEVGATILDSILGLRA